MPFTLLMFIILTVFGSMTGAQQLQIERLFIAGRSAMDAPVTSAPSSGPTFAPAQLPTPPSLRSVEPVTPSTELNSPPQLYRSQVRKGGKLIVR